VNGVHDLGGMHGFGPVVRDPGRPRLEPWEAVMVAIQADTQARGCLNIDEFRHAIERMEPVHYLASSYFEHWLDGIARLLAETGYVSTDELDERTRALEAGVTQHRAAAGELRPFVSWTGYRREVGSAPLYARGAPVRTAAFAPRGHTRLARYARGKLGTVHAHHGAYVFPDAHAHGNGEDPQHLYSVRFDSQELWGAHAEPGTSVFIDLWEPYLSAVEAR
jgi:nitrile hydratase subunit beta